MNYYQYIYSRLELRHIIDINIAIISSFSNPVVRIYIEFIIYRIRVSVSGYIIIEHKYRI